MDMTTSTSQPPLSGAAPGPRPDAPAPADGADRTARAWKLAVVATLVVGVVARFATSSPLWLDEALSVNIARLPLGDLPDALRHDGSPPLYYVILHGWMELVGTGTVAVRALSGLFGVAALPLAWLAGRRLGGRSVAWASLLVAAASPFAIRYSTEARMYSLLMLLVLCGLLAVQRLLAGGGRGPAVALGSVTGALLLTHYWAFYLVGAAALALALLAFRGEDEERPRARRALVAMAAGALLFVPWVPTFLHQLANTGTPWGRPGGLRSILDTVVEFGGGYGDAGMLLGLALMGLIVVAMLGRPAGAGGGILLDRRHRGAGFRLAVVGVTALALGILAGHLTGAAFAARYVSTVFPLFVLVIGAGIAAVPGRRGRRGVLAVVVVLGLWAAWPNAFEVRTSAGLVAEALDTWARPGHVVVYCPDQLGPAVSRLLPDDAGLRQLTFPRGDPPELVDWTGYEETNEAASPLAFARQVLDLAGDEPIWVVRAPGYRTFGSKCERLIEYLEDARTDALEVVPSLGRYFEQPGVVRVSSPGPRVGFGA